MSRKALTSETLKEIIRRVVEIANPERIILFGSAARSEMNSDSDVDLLVIKDGEYNHGSILGDIYVNLIGVGQAVDVVLVTSEQVEQYRDVHCLIIKPALQEGKEVYRAATISVAGL